MASPSPEQATLAARAAYQAGFRGNQLVTAVAIALAESNGNPTAHNPRPPDDSYGLWQINYYDSLRAARTALFGPPEGLYDPYKNAQAAYKISGGGKSFNPWTTYTSGKYRTYMDQAQTAVVAAGAGGSVGSTGNVPGTYDLSGAELISSSSSSEAGDDDCLWKLDVGFIHGCLLKRSQARALGGGALLVAGSVVMAVGVSLLVGRNVPLPYGIPNPMKSKGPKPDADDKLAIASEGVERSRPPRRNIAGTTVVGGTLEPL